MNDLPPQTRKNAEIAGFAILTAFLMALGPLGLALGLAGIYLSKKTITGFSVVVATIPLLLLIVFCQYDGDETEWTVGDLEYLVIVEKERKSRLEAYRTPRYHNVSRSGMQGGDYRVRVKNVWDTHYREVYDTVFTATSNSTCWRFVERVNDDIELEIGDTIGTYLPTVPDRNHRMSQENGYNISECIYTSKRRKCRLKNDRQIRLEEKRLAMLSWPQFIIELRRLFSSQ